LLSVKSKTTCESRGVGTNYFIFVTPERTSGLPHEAEAKRGVQSILDGRPTKRDWIPDVARE